MDKKIECEVVQDLLLGYLDNTLNVESKKLVENHFEKCEKCRERLEKIKEDTDKDENNQKKEIDYLKKVRIRSKVKSFILAVCIVCFVIILIYLSKFIKISSFMNKANKSLEATNYYFESNEILGDGQVGVKKVYYKDGKYKEICANYSDGGKKIYYTRYGEVGSDTIIEIDEENNKVYVKKGETYKNFNKEENIKWNRYQATERNSIVANLGKAFTLSIHDEKTTDGKKYYILKNQSEVNQGDEIWIDKETGLVVKEVSKEVEKRYIADTDIIKEINDRIIIYKYEFGTVTDDDVNVPVFGDTYQKQVQEDV